jgi:uncharacterized protein (DUF1800 family)
LVERLQLFWANHFTVSLTKGSARGLVGAFERDAIRPNLNGSFETLLKAATTHPAMLRYLDNSQSAGPHSLVVARERRRAARIGEPARVTGINENLAREVLELHTLGAGERPRRGRRRRLHASRRHRIRRGADRLARRAGRGRRRIAIRCRLARAGAEARARQALSGGSLTRSARCCTTWPSIPRPRASSRPSWRATSSLTHRPPALVERLAAAFLQSSGRPADGLPRARAQPRGLGLPSSAS